MSKAKVEYCMAIIKAADELDFRLLGKIIDYVTELQEIRQIDNQVIANINNDNIKFKQVLSDARKCLKNIWDNTDFCACPAEGDCVCGQSELANIIKKIDEVI